MNDFLVAYLDTIDERLLEYLDEDDELSLETVQRLRYYTSELLAGSITPAHITEDWPDWFHLAPAFVVTYAADLANLEEQSSLLDAVEEHEAERVTLTAADRTYLVALESQLDLYREMRDEGEEAAGE